MAHALRRPAFSFLKRTFLVWLAFVLSAITFGHKQSSGYADLVVKNANVITVNRNQPRAQGFAVQQGHFLAVGTNADIAKFVGPKTKVLNLAGQSVTPGFIDCHMHPSAIFPEDAPYASVPLDPKHIHSMAELIAALKKHAQLVPKGYWIRGTRYDDLKLGRHPTRFDLDQASTEHPISISHVSGHISVVNTLALKNGGITKDTPNPSGGAFDRDENGEPNGVCRESARVGSGGAPSLSPSQDQRLEGLQKCFENFLAKGITSASDAAASPDSLRNYQELHAKGCPVRINVMMMHNYLGQLTGLGLHGPFGNDHLRLGTVKVFHGNSFSGRTCWVSKAYEGRPNYFGIPPAASQDSLNTLILNIQKAGFQPAVHSNGDREITMVLEAFENAQKLFPRKDTRFRIEHCSVCTPEILARSKRDGVVLVFHSYMWENGDKLKDFGTDRYDWLAPMARARAMGIHVTSHSDYSVSAADPLLRIQDLVTRRTEAGVVIGADQCISPEEAIRTWTLDAAYATFEEGIKGSIEPGKLADFVVLGADPTKVKPLNIRKIQVQQTYIDGKLAWKFKKEIETPPAGEED
jgi:predicted amidohydrolase YtcJ